MVGATDEAVVAGLFEIGVEAVVEVIGAFCGFDEHEAQALAVDFGCGKCVPINLALMMTYVDSAYGIALGVSGVAKDALPGYGVGTDEEGVKGYGAEGEKQYGSRPHGVGGYSVGDLHDSQRFQEARNASFFSCACSRFSSCHVCLVGWWFVGTKMVATWFRLRLCLQVAFF